MNNKIKTGVLSFGMSGTLFHAPFLETHDGFELYGVVERTKKNVKSKYPNVKSFDSVVELLADDEIELVVINTPTSTHYEFALKAIQANKHILVEKPFTVTSKEAKHLFEEAKKRSLNILPFQNRRYDSDFLTVKNILDSGKLGKLIEVYIRYDRYKPKLGNNASKETRIPGNGVVYNLGPHLVDAAILLFGKPLTWTKTIGHYRPNTQIDDYFQIHLTYPEGLQVFLTSSLLVAEEGPAFVFNGSKGSYNKYRTDVQEKQLQEGMSPDNPLFGIEESGKEGLLTTISSDGIKSQEKIAAIQSSYLNVFEDVYQAIRKGIPYPVTEEQILQQLEILES